MQLKRVVLLALGALVLGLFVGLLWSGCHNRHTATTQESVLEANAIVIAIQTPISGIAIADELVVGVNEIEVEIDQQSWHEMISMETARAIPIDVDDIDDLLADSDVYTLMPEKHVRALLSAIGPENIKQYGYGTVAFQGHHGLAFADLSALFWRPIRQRPHGPVHVFVCPRAATAPPTDV